MILPAEVQILNRSYVGVGCVLEGSPRETRCEMFFAEGKGERKCILTSFLLDTQFKGEPPASSSHLLIILQQIAFLPCQKTKKKNIILLASFMFVHCKASDPHTYCTVQRRACSVSTVQAFLQ